MKVKVSLTLGSKLNREGRKTVKVSLAQGSKLNREERTEVKLSLGKQTYQRRMDERKSIFSSG